MVGSYVQKIVKRSLDHFSRKLGQRVGGAAVCPGPGRYRGTTLGLLWRPAGHGVQLLVIIILIFNTKNKYLYIPRSLGYSSVQGLFKDFSGSIKAQMDGLFSFIKTHSICYNALKSNPVNYFEFAGCYNGNG